MRRSLFLLPLFRFLHPNPLYALPHVLPASSPLRAPPTPRLSCAHSCTTSCWSRTSPLSSSSGSSRCSSGRARQWR